MKKLKKEYRKKKISLILSIVKRYLEGNHIELDSKIERVVHLLYAYGLHPTMSCEGHTPPYKGVDTFRAFWPYVQLRINNKVVFDLEKKEDEGRLRVVTEMDHTKTLRRLNKLIVDFNLSHHPFWEKRLELSATPSTYCINSFDPFHLLESLEKNWNLHVLLCDVGVQGILTMPQELLNNDLRNKFLLRAQSQMELFTKFLEWNYVENGPEDF